MLYEIDPRIAWRDQPIDEAREKIASIAPEIVWDGLDYATDFTPADQPIDTVRISAYTDYPDIVTFELTDGHALRTLDPDFAPTTADVVVAILQIDTDTVEALIATLTPAMETAKSRYKND